MAHPLKPEASATLVQLKAIEPAYPLYGAIELQGGSSLQEALARRNGVGLPYPDVAAIHAAYKFTNLQDFLDLYYKGMSVLLHEQDFYDLAIAYLRRAAGQNVRHAEIFFDPQGHTARGISFKTVIDGLWRALKDAERQFGLTASLILCFLRHLDEALP